MLNPCWRTILFVLLFFWPAMLAGQLRSGDGQDLSVLTESLRNFEQHYLGHYVEFESPDELRFWYGRTGDFAQVQHMLGGENTTKAWNLQYWNSKWKIGVSKSLVGSGKREIYSCTGNDADYAGVFLYAGSFMLGRDIRTFRLFSEIATDPNSTVKVNQRSDDGKTLVVLTVESPKFADHEFVFDNNLLVNYSSKLDRGVLVMDYKTSAYVPWEPGEGFRTWKREYGPIKYDDNGKPTYVENVKFTRITNDGSIESFKPPEVRISKYRLDDDLSPDGIDVEKFGIPSVLPIKVFNEAVPYELRNGRLLKVLDGNAENIIKEVKFRSPSFWSKWRYFLLAGLLLFFVGVFLWNKK